MGAGPESFNFHGDMASVGAREHEAQQIVNHCKEYIEMANRGYEQDLKREAKQKEAQEREKLMREVQEVEARNRVLRNLKI